ncbi:amidase [Aerococcus agrisoli]|uniref:Amidase n=1 Tax=Aerococcus agrisoli TaxID=2487350 RepID=A0A3N4HFH8_9LACT|nr:amidase [Aerococcus agrisoli]RPA65454.1 amidase [Aerococcus agrisoli]
MLFTEDATYYAQQIKARKYTVTQLVEWALENIEALNPKLNAVIYLQDQYARTKAKEYDAYIANLSDDEMADLPDFFGVPTLLKDLGQNQAGFLSSSGSKLTLDSLMQKTDHLVEDIIKAGFVILGRTNVPEFGFKGISDAKITGAVNSPIDLSRNPGGSSGGAAAALKAGIVPLALGSDGGGSIRMPASYSGLIGLKPSRGRVAVGPVTYRSWQGAAVNFALTKSVRDTWTLLQNLQVQQMDAPFIMPTIEETELKALDRPLKIGYIGQLNADWPLHEEAQALLDQTIAQLRDWGHEVFEYQEPFDRAENMRNYFEMNSVETAATMDNIERASGRPVVFDDVEPLTWAIYRAGLKIPSYRYSQLLYEWDQWAAASQADFASKMDLILTPATNGPAPLHGELVPDDLETLVEKEKHIDDYDKDAQQDIIWHHFEKGIVRSPYTSLVNMVGQPAISLPVYKTADGLPIGAQFVAAKGNEYLLLQVAKQFEEANLLDTSIVDVEA